jgi:hypothetical protein
MPLRSAQGKLLAEADVHVHQAEVHVLLALAERGRIGAVQPQTVLQGGVEIGEGLGYVRDCHLTLRPAAAMGRTRAPTGAGGAWSG